MPNAHDTNGSDGGPSDWPQINGSPKKLWEMTEEEVEKLFEDQGGSDE